MTYFTDALQQLTPLLVHGGPIILLLAVLSIASMTIFIAKWLQFAYLGINRSDFIHDSLSLWRRGQFVPAIKAMGHHQKRPAAQVVEAAMSGVMDHQDTVSVREEVTRIAKLQIAKLQSWLKPLELIANISPLLGLLGTVLGMIEAFKQLEQAGNRVDPSILSGGIWQALLTTAIGLAVAIPAMLAHQWLERKVERSALMMEDAATQVFTSGPKNATDWRAD